MQLHEIESHLANLGTSDGCDLVFDLLKAYGVPASSIARLKGGGYDKSDDPDAVLWPKKVFFRRISEGIDIHVAIDAAAGAEPISRHRPRFLIVQSGDRVVSMDTHNGGTLDVSLGELQRHATFFLPWAGMEKTQVESVNVADARAAARMARLYDEVVKHNHIQTDEDVHALNVFFSRLLFCFFAEDTRVFPRDSFTNGIASHTAADGSDTGSYLDALFDVLDTAPENRRDVPSHFATFDYVNGRLFSTRTSAPRFSRSAREIIIECGSLDWSVINPDIFGSMMQAVVKPGHRDGLGMHYTSVENIKKVIGPLFLDDLQTAFEAADTKPKLERLHRRLAAIKCFDPACGSGNFLVIAYKELRKLEHEVLRRLQEVDPKAPLTLFEDSQIRLQNFYGIEIDDFAHEVAILSLWLTKHQMNVEFKELFGHEIRLIPLRDTGNVVCANAARVSWDDVCPTDTGDEVYVLGNPPYQGGTKQTEQQKRDLVTAFEDPAINRYLDYVSAWLIKGARFVADHDAELGFVTTNSVSQGNHVGLLWPHIQRTAAEITFAYSSFPWSNSAKANAGVTCVIIGLSRPGKRPVKWVYSNGTRSRASTINCYLVADGADVIVMATDERGSELPKMAFGSMPRDGGHLLLSRAERDDLLRDAPDAEQFVKRYTGAEEFLQGGERFCLWVPDGREADAMAIPALQDRFARVRAERLKSRADSTRKAAQTPYRFVQVAHRDGTSIMVPRVSSQRREYVPIGFLDGKTVINDQGNAIYGAEAWLFALLSSRMHNAWVRAVGGRMKTDIRYSATLCYNTFPVPDLSAASRQLLTDRTFAILAAREQHADKTLAQIYDPGKMPFGLREAHQFLDAAVDQIYRRRPFRSDDERLELLFKMYAASGPTDLRPPVLEAVGDA